MEYIINLGWEFLDTWHKHVPNFSLNDSEQIILLIDSNNLFRFSCYWGPDAYCKNETPMGPVSTSLYAKILYCKKHLIAGQLLVTDGIWYSF